MPYLIITVTLYLFWLLLSGHYNAMLLSLGGVSVLLVVGLVWRMNRVDGEPHFVFPDLSVVAYGLWLMWSVVKANIDVVRRIWDPKMPIDPHWRRLDTRLTTRLQKTLYANSITLTPGTLTTRIGDDHLMVHSLSKAGLEELQQGEMERRIQRLGG